MIFVKKCKLIEIISGVVLITAKLPGNYNLCHQKDMKKKFKKSA